MTLYTILFGDFQAPPVARTIKHRLDCTFVEPRERGRPSTVTGQIIDVVTQHAGLSANEITHSIGASYTTVMNTLVRLIARRQLRRVKQGASYKYFRG